jgi:arylsulfatase A
MPQNMLAESTTSMKSLAILFASLSLLASHSLAADAKPNIVVILSDDYGYGSLGCYGADPA